MKYFIISVFLFALTGAQHSQNAAILSDNRYLTGDGTFGASYKQEDGVEFKEESDANGDRKGSYSYVDPNGVRRTVTYTAGKNGFQATGDGIPRAPPQAAPQPEYEPLPQYNPPDYRPPARSYQQYQPQRPDYQPRPSPAPPAPISRDFFRNEQYNHQPEYRPEPQYRPEPIKYSFNSPITPSPRPQYNDITTPPPRRFYPPGKLDFTRTPDGFSYSFSKAK